MFENSNCIRLYCHFKLLKNVAILFSKIASQVSTNETIWFQFYGYPQIIIPNLPHCKYEYFILKSYIFLHWLNLVYFILNGFGSFGRMD